MYYRTILVLLLLLAWPAIAEPTSRPTTGPTTRAAVLDGLIVKAGASPLLESQRRNVRAQRDMYEAMPIAATYRLEQVVRFSLVDGFLRAEFGNSSADSTQSRFKVEGSTSTWIARAFVNAGANQGKFNYLCRYDFDQNVDGQTWQSTLARRR